MHQAIGRLRVTPDNSTPGSEGRLYLQLPEEMAYLRGGLFRCIGNFTKDGVVLLVSRGADTDAHAKSVTPNGQVWWKNGVRDHGLREHWRVDILYMELAQGHTQLVVTLLDPTYEMVLPLPPRQNTLGLA